MFPVDWPKVDDWAITVEAAARAVVIMTIDPSISRSGTSKCSEFEKAGQVRVSQQGSDDRKRGR